jgi:hypothetical protein
MDRRTGRFCRSGASFAGRVPPLTGLRLSCTRPGRYIRRARTAHGTTYYVIPTGTSGLGGIPLGARCLGDWITAARHVRPGIPTAQRAATVRFLETFMA